eukprot:748002-Rhodomonas_salina.2
MSARKGSPGPSIRAMLKGSGSQLVEVTASLLTGPGKERLRPPGQLRQTRPAALRKTWRLSQAQAAVHDNTSRHPMINRELTQQDPQPPSVRLGCGGASRCRVVTVQGRFLPLHRLRLTVPGGANTSSPSTQPPVPDSELTQ